jgi:hypothetical protein
MGDKMVDILKDIAAIMDKELLHTVEYTSGEMTLKITKAGFNTPNTDLLEAKGTEESDEETLFWSSDNGNSPII